MLILRIMIFHYIFLNINIPLIKNNSLKFIEIINITTKIQKSSSLKINTSMLDERITRDRILKPLASN